MVFLCTRLFKLSKQTVQVSLITLIYLTIGIVFYGHVECKVETDDSVCLEHWTVVDALYFSIVTMSTVGYGDLTPTTTGSKAFTILYIFFGITMVFSQIASACAGTLESMEIVFLKVIDIFDRTENGMSGRQLGFSGKKVDLSANGVADFVAPPGPVIFWTQRLASWLVLAILFQLLSAAAFQVTEPDLSYFDAFYHSFVTATTVGYGDIGMTTQASRLLACFHIMLSVTLFAALVGRVQELLFVRKSELQRASILMKNLDPDWFANVLHGMDNDGAGVDRLEFVVGMLTNMGVELCGQPLEWSDVKPLLAQFDAADKTGDGRLTEDDLRKLAQNNQLKNPSSPTAKVVPVVPELS